MKWSRILYLVLLVMIVAFLYAMFFRQTDAPRQASITEVAQLAEDGQIQKIVVRDDALEITLTDGTKLASTKETGLDVLQTLTHLGVSKAQLGGDKIRVEVAAPSWWSSGLVTILSAVLPLVLIGAFFFIVRQAQGTNNQALSFGKSRARMFTGDKPTVTFEDVAGADEAKQELAEVVEFLREPEKFISLGARIPKGVLMVGPPGCGKTLLAKAVSGEAGVPFFSISGSEFVEMFVGVGASRVRDLFDQAKRNSPCIVFVDEIDAVGRHRGAGLGGSHDEREQTLNQILVEMDGFDTDTNVIVMAATNRPDILDPALLRPGRFDRRVVLDRPDRIGREQILDVHVRGKPMSSDVKRRSRRQTPGFVGADLENLVNEAAILAARRNKKIIEMPEFQEAVEKVVAGPDLVENKFDEDARAVLVHLKGQPARSTRRFIKRLNETMKLPVVAFTDGDPWSFRIHASLAYGAIKTAHLSEYLATPTVKFMGITASEILNHELPTDKLNDKDIEALNAEKTDPRSKDELWKHEHKTSCSRSARRRSSRRSRSTAWTT